MSKFELFISSLTVISVFTIILQYAYPLDESQQTAAYVFDLIVVGMLIFDFYKRFRESKRGYRFLLSNWYEIPAMIPLLVFGLIETQSVASVLLRTLRLIRLFRLARLLKITYIGSNRFVYLIVFSTIIIISGSLSIYYIEESVDGTKFTNIGDAFWWTLVTVTTVGYGDIYPITTEGRIVATFLMFSGIAILGVFISTLGAAIIDNKQKSSSLADETKTLIKSKIDNLENLSHADITLLNEMIKNTHENLRNKDFDA